MRQAILTDRDHDGASDGGLPISEQTSQATLTGRADRLLLMGVARSGTSWLGRALGRAKSVRYYAEPDNVDTEHEGKQPGWLGFGPYPVLVPGHDYPSFSALWDLVFSGRLPRRRGVQVAAGKVVLRLPKPVRDPMLHSAAKILSSAVPGPRCSVVKSIFLPFAVDWLLERYEPRVVVIQRNPLGVVSSWMKLGISEFDLPTRPVIRELYLDRLGIAPPPAGASQLTVTAWTVGLLTTALSESVSQHPGWLLVDHENLCVEPLQKIGDLYKKLGLTWSDATARYLAEADREGEGLKPFRVTADQPDQWKGRLSADQFEEINQVLEQFPSKGWVGRPGVSTPALADARP